MPEPGFQHKLGGIASFNPFDDGPQKLSPYTVEEITTLQSRLDKQLGPEYISSRPGAGGAKVHYLAGEKVINLANEVFGFNGWSSSIRNVQIDFVDESKESGKVSLGLSVVMRVTLRDGTYHEDIGYGHIENCKGKAPAFEKAKKEGTTDALKRALRNFGNVLGNCVYDKNYIKEVTKIRVPPPRFDPMNLHRHPDIVPPTPGPSMASRNATSISKPMFEDTKPVIKSAREESKGDEYGGDEFDDEFCHILVEGEDSSFDGLHPDEVVLEPSKPTPTVPQPTPNNNRNSLGGGQMGGYGGPGGPADSPLLNRRSSTNQLPPNQNPQTPTPKANQQFQSPTGPQNYQQKPPPQPNMQPGQWQGIGPGSNIGQNMGPPQQRPPQQVQNPQSGARAPTPNNIPTLPTPQLNATAQTQQKPPPHTQQSPPVGFFSARAADSFQGDAPPPEAPVFNPHHQTSIPRSLGIDHNKSSPIPRKLIGNPGGPVGPGMTNPIAKPDFNSPGGSSIGFRQIGMPPSQGGRPQQNTTPYRPPSVAPPGYQGGAGTKRLSDGAPIGNSGQNLHRSALNDASHAQLNSANGQGQGQGQQGQQAQYNRNDTKRMKN